MTLNQTRLRQLLLLESILAVGGIVLASLCYLYSLQRQQSIAEQLFQHPFAVTQASTEFRGDIIDLRRRILEAALASAPANDPRWRQIAEIESRLDRNFRIMRENFLGEPRHVQMIAEELTAWRQRSRDLQVAVQSGQDEQARHVALAIGKAHVDPLIKETDAVIGFARFRAQAFVDQGRAELQQVKWLMVSAMTLLLLVFFWVALKLRAAICELFDKIEHDAMFDGLTGAYARLTLIRQGDAELLRARRHGFALSVLFLDIDHFKSINDDHGHAAGDSVLRQFAGLCARHLRDGDSLGRIGGEEFVILLPYADSKGACEAAERIRTDVENTLFASGKGVRLNVTISVGVTCSDRSPGEFSNLLQRADQALYQAKQQGRNRVCVDD